MDLKLKRFDQKLFDLTQASWNEQMEELKDLVFIPNFSQKLELVQQQIGDKSGTIHVYAIVDQSNNGHVVAIIELSHAMPKSKEPWLKMLNMTVQPIFDINAGRASADELADVASSCISEAYGLIYAKHPSSVLKILGNNTLSVDFLRGVATTLKENGIQADTQGGWLIIKKVELDS